jgi:hypothetical protein
VALPLAVYYCLHGTIYQAPVIHSVFTSRVVCSHSAVIDVFRPQHYFTFKRPSKKLQATILLILIQVTFGILPNQVSYLPPISTSLEEIPKPKILPTLADQDDQKKIKEDITQMDKILFSLFAQVLSHSVV